MFHKRLQSTCNYVLSVQSEIKQVEEERDRLRRELHKVREQLHEEHNLHSPVPFEDPVLSDESTQVIIPFNFPH